MALKAVGTLCLLRRVLTGVSHWQQEENWYNRRRVDPCNRCGAIKNLLLSVSFPIFYPSETFRAWGRIFVISDVNVYVIIRNSLDCIFKIFLVFIRRQEIKTAYCDRFDGTSDMNAATVFNGRVRISALPTQRFSEYTGQRNINPLLPNG
jgi:hypothetical protein